MDALVEPDSDADASEAVIEDASITWRGDGKFLATVSSVEQGESTQQHRQCLCDMRLLPLPW